jgi:hypothetical protein
MKLDATVISQLNQAVYATWNYIGSDAMEFCESNGDAIEMVLDADRMTTCGNAPEADALVSELIKEHGYSKVSKFLSKNFRLV